MEQLSFHFFDEDCINLQATQLISDDDFKDYSGCHKTEADLIDGINGVEMEIDQNENGNTKNGFQADDMPEIPNDDDNDDFSWLFKILPSETVQSDQTVPTGEFPPFENENFQVCTPIIGAPSFVESNSLLVDTVFSSMDVTSLISNDDDNEMKITFHKVEESSEESPKAHIQNNEQSKPNLRRSCRAKRSVLLLDRTKEMITDTPVSLRQSQRKRSYQQMIDAEVKNNVNVKDETNNGNKRRRVQSKQSESKRPHHNQHPTHDSIQPVKNELKIILRKHAPVNPLDRKLISVKSFSKGLLDARKVLSIELYLKQSLQSLSVPILDESCPSLLVEKALNPKQIMDLLRVEWLENHNAIAIAKAHGKETLGSKKLTSNGKSTKGRFVTMDLSNDLYENILRNQNSAKLNWINRKHAQNHTMNPELDSSSFNKFDSTFSNFSNFDNYFSDDDEVSFYGKERPRKRCFGGIVGAVPVSKLHIASKIKSAKWPIFHFKGQLYRPNPVVVTLQRVPDHVIEEIKSKPKKITLQSTYYNALASYFKERPK